MTLNLRWRTLLLASLVSLMGFAGSVAAQEVPMVTGEHWTKSSEEAKKAYLVGIANMAQVEMAFAGSNPPSDAQTVIPRMAKGLKGQTLDSVRDALNKWYASHPDQIQRPVFETIWFEMVVPGLRNPK